MDKYTHNIDSWHKLYKYHINELFKIFISHLNKIDRNHQSNNDHIYWKFVAFLYNNSSHLKLFSDLDEDITDNDNDDELIYLQNADIML